MKIKAIQNWVNLSVNSGLALLGLGFALCFSTAAHAEFRSVVPAKAIMFDAPSVEASKVYIMSQGYPLEIIVDLGAWVKVRDQQGGLSWIESKNLASKRTVLVTTAAEIKASENIDSALVASIEKDVVLELVSPKIKNGWVNVKHRDGATGYIQSSAIWGLN